MQLQRDPPLHLTYCLNIHPGETWADNLFAIRTKALAVRDRVASNRPFGLGLRLGRRAAETLAQPEARRDLKALLARENLYVFTINGFPYGPFHGTPVKERVYAPDWRDPARLEYTNLLANILADLLPEGVSGSISTVPGSFKPWIRTRLGVHLMAENLLWCVDHLAGLYAKTGREIHLGLEPEPGCFLESTDEVLRFFHEQLTPVNELRVRRHLGVCLDTCHMALQFEEPSDALARLAAAGIRISKVQLSAALEADAAPASLAALRAYDEPVYLHQVRARSAGGATAAWTDLPQALAELPGTPAAEAVRVHFHVPLFWEGAGALRSTASALSPAFFARLKLGATEHLEIETYTFGVLPEAQRAIGAVESLAREFQWVLARLSQPA
jgi:sugar phosphate isomerase/epimerase